MRFCIKLTNHEVSNQRIKTQWNYSHQNQIIDNLCHKEYRNAVVATDIFMTVYFSKYIIKN